MHPSIGQTVVFTYTDDLEMTSRFFREIMELDFVVDQGGCHIYKLSETSFLGVCNLPDRPTEQAGVTITIVSDDVDGWYDFLTAKGVDYVRKPAHSGTFGIYSSMFLSPHGYSVEIQQFNDRDWHLRRLDRV
ncbi:VOC family protein [Pseudohoeflea suaedae]|uniref:VOC family protein n=1 Tax=Pseudohoeflea suaedae TaxID=877384 RepID=A0A4R5PMK0_9HYPH|nr:VOC family protein [Pseudohoeflea suaedae]TDH38129.1 VOC family protein [Pseudohoeflea suaedae]